MGFLSQRSKFGAEKRLRRELSTGHEEVEFLCTKLESAVENNEDMLYEILKHLDARSLASASCVSRRWRKAAEDETLWEGLCCTQNWAASGPQQLKSVVLALGGFRRLYILCLRPLLLRPSQRLLTCAQLENSDGGGRHWSKDEIYLSLSLFSIDCYERLGRRGSSSCTPSSLDLLCKASSWQVELSSRKHSNRTDGSVVSTFCRTSM